MKEELEVTAEVIEPSKEIQVCYTPAVITDNLKALAAYVESQLDYYKGITIDPEDQRQIKDARAVMADLNKLKEPIEVERKRIKREYEAPLKAFEASVKEITQKIDSARSDIKAQVDAADELFKENRRAHLEEEYSGVAGILVEVIPFSAILDPKWLNRSTSESAAEAKLQEKAATALKGYETLLTKNLTHKDEVMKHYAETLDVISSLELEDELAAKDRALEEFKAKQEALEAAKPTAEPVQDVEKQAAMPEPEEQVEQPRDDAFVWSLEMEFSGTREYAQSVANALKRLGITGATIKAVRRVENV